MKISNLIPHIAVLKDYLIRKDGNRADNSMSEEEWKKANDTMRSRVMLLEQLPYFLDSSCFFISQIIKLQLSLVETKINLLSNPNVHNLTPDERDPIAFMTDSFFNSARRVQDAIIPYVSRSFSLSLPNSMNELIKKLKEEKISLHHPIKEQLMIYWDSSGKKLKAYRDLGQHHALISSEGWVAKTPDGKAIIHLSLPNNPEEKNILRLKYDNPVILALPYLVLEFQNLMGLVFKVTDLLLPTEINRNKKNVTFSFRNFPMGKGMEMHFIENETVFEDANKEYLESLLNWSKENQLVERPPLDPNFKEGF